MSWYNDYLANDDINILCEEYQPNITFADPRRLLLQQIINYGNSSFTIPKGQCINVQSKPLRRKKIKHDVTIYRCRLKFPWIVTISAVDKAADNVATWTVDGVTGKPDTKWAGKTYPAEYMVLYLSTYNQGWDSQGHAEVRAVPINTILESKHTGEDIVVVDFDKNANAVLIRRDVLYPSETDAKNAGVLAGTIFRTSQTEPTLKAEFAAGKQWEIKTTALYEKDWASDNAGMEKVAVYKNYVQFFDTIFGSTLTADNTIFHGGDPRKALDRFHCERLSEKIEKALLKGQGRYIEDPEDSVNRMQTMQGVLAALSQGPNAAENCVSLLENSGSGLLTIDRFNNWIDFLSQKDTCDFIFCSARLLSAVNKLDRQFVRTSFGEIWTGNQILGWRSDLSKTKLIYYPLLDDAIPVTIHGKEDLGAVTVDAIKYNFDKHARIRTLIPLTVRDKIGTREARTYSEKWLFTALTAEWNHPELGGLLCDVQGA